MSKKTHEMEHFISSVESLVKGPAGRRVANGPSCFVRRRLGQRHPMQRKSIPFHYITKTILLCPIIYDNNMTLYVLII